MDPSSHGGEPEPIRSDPVRIRLYVALGSVLTVVGLLGFGISTFSARSTPADGNAPADVAWPSGVILAAAVCTGVGVFLLLRALVAALRDRRISSASRPADSPSGRIGPTDRPRRR